MNATQTPSYDDVWKDVYGDMQDKGPAHRHMRRIVAGVLGELDYGSALEVGCGAGHNFPLLAAGGRSPRLAGVDISDEALIRARERAPGVDLRRLDIQTERLHDTWDLVFSSLVLEHLPDDRAALENMRAMTGRWLLIATIGGDFERYRNWEERVGHVRNYRQGELEAKVAAAGFALERVVRWGFPFYTPIARRIQNGMSPAASYGLPARLMAHAMHALYFLNSRRRGDLLILLARAA